MDIPQLPGQSSLEDFLLQPTEAQVEAGEETRYTIPSGDDVEASRIMRQLGALEKQIAANARTAESERARVSLWEAGVNQTIEAQALRLRRYLHDYAVRERNDTDRKTISLPFGVIKTTPAKGQWEFEDEAAFMTWAKSANIADLMRTVTKPALSVAKNALVDVGDGTVATPDGELVPGVRVVAPGVPLNISIKTTN